MMLILVFPLFIFLVYLHKRNEKEALSESEALIASMAQDTILSHRAVYCSGHTDCPNVVFLPSIYFDDLNKWMRLTLSIPENEACVIFGMRMVKWDKQYIRISRE